MKLLRRIPAPTIDIELSSVVGGVSQKATLNEYEFRTLQLEFAQGLRTFDKVKYVIDNEEGTILQDGSCTVHLSLFSMADEIALEIYLLKNNHHRLENRTEQ